MWLWRYRQGKVGTGSQKIFKFPIEEYFFWLEGHFVLCISPQPLNRFFKFFLRAHICMKTHFLVPWDGKKEVLYHWAEKCTFYCFLHQTAILDYVEQIIVGSKTRPSQVSLEKRIIKKDAEITKILIFTFVAILLRDTVFAKNIHRNSQSIDVENIYSSMYRSPTMICC